jgi:hypothetical protein
MAEIEAKKESEGSVRGRKNIIFGGRRDKVFGSIHAPLIGLFAEDCWPRT